MHHLPPLFLSPSTDWLSSHSHLYNLAQQLSQRYHAHRVTEAALKTIGLTLWQVLDVDASLPPQALMIECHDNAIDSLPWECLYHPELGFLGKHPDYTLSRRVRGNIPQPPKGPLKILLLTAQPEKISYQRARLDIEIEQQQLYTALMPFISAGWVRFYAPNDGRFSTFVELLHSQPWHLVILSGHGFVPKTTDAIARSDSNRLDEQSISCKRKQAQAFFVFESEEGHGELVAAHTLAQVFNGTNVQCVVVAACQSAQSNINGTEASLIKPIARAGVPHVVGIREPLIDRAATVFVQTLCVALAQRERVDVAVQKSRRAMTQLLASNEVWRDVAVGCGHSDASVGQWCLPTLLSHDPAQPVVDWHFRPKPSKPDPLGSQIALPNVFIGRRRELRTLGEALATGKIRRLLIRGAGGLGKTALAGRLAMTLAQQGYRVLAYQAGGEMGFIETLAQVLESLKTKTEFSQHTVGPSIEVSKDQSRLAMEFRDVFFEALLAKLAQGRWLLWIDGLECVQNPRSGALTDESLQIALEMLSRWEAADLRILLTCRWDIPQATDFYDYRLKCPNFSDFSRYLQHLGLSYPFPQLLTIYKRLGGNFQAVQLLQSMPPCLDAPGLNKQLAIVRRYLQAYQRYQ
ncbi:MAG: hypothetical protein DRR08_29395 [Candidatus Parabeggiatoa sp. nov. 2]|nr:MAG: hypothetical protein B6247_31325 [Beggiatoa sp. 4572_84]RKZ51322.1 MAG: hypothetical protein DRR08_29395 [Gammaproteobacteria bacterium]